MLCSIPQAIFLAHGPAFRENFTASPFENIELYNLMSGKSIYDMKLFDTVIYLPIFIQQYNTIGTQIQIQVYVYNSDEKAI